VQNEEKKRRDDACKKKKKDAKNVFSRERLTLCNSQSPFTFADIAGSEVGLTAMRSAMSDAAAAFCAAVASSPRPEGRGERDDALLERRRGVAGRGLGGWRGDRVVRGVGVDGDVARGGRGAARAPGDAGDGTSG